MVMRTNLISAAATAILMSSVYAHTSYYMKGYKIGREYGKTRGGGTAGITHYDIR
jgi:hypothetical protein